MVDYKRRSDNATEASKSSTLPGKTKVRTSRIRLRRYAHDSPNLVHAKSRGNGNLHTPHVRPQLVAQAKPASSQRLRASVRLRHPAHVPRSEFRQNLGAL